MTARTASRTSSKAKLKTLQCRIQPKVSVPLYGPLQIENAECFMMKQREIFQKCFPMPCPCQKTTDKFDPVGLLGEGGFGKVYLVTYKKTEKLYAMKIMQKKFLVDNEYVMFALNEKRILQSLNFPFCVRLEFLAQDKSSLYFFLPFISGGEVYTHFKIFKRFSEDLTKFYAAQVVLALEFLHYCDLVYRDLKPENILVDHTGFIKVTDFGFTKEVKKRLYTFCGTPEYIAPEIILGLGHCKAVDYWSLGVLIFEMVKGKTPFHSENDMETFKKIVSVQYEMPLSFSKELQDLIKNLLQADTTHRYGNLHKGIDDIKQHKWFAETNWLDLLNRKVTPPFVPSDDDITSNFPHAAEVKDIFNTNPPDEDFDKYFKDF